MVIDTDIKTWVCKIEDKFRLESAVDMYNSVILLWNMMVTVVNNSQDIGLLRSPHPLTTAYFIALLPKGRWWHYWAKINAELLH